jgi:hypothetical protein
LCTSDGFAEWGSSFLYLLLDAPGETGGGSVAVNKADLVKTDIEGIGDLVWERVVGSLNLAFGHD